MTTTFVDFYREHQISPVGVDLSRPERHFENRASLYRLLGIPPRAVRGATVVELCAGSGYNALYTQSLEPASYVLVDANPTGLDHARELFATRMPHARVEFVDSFVESFRPERRFDLVICEGAIPFQRDPVQLARELPRLAEPGGILIVTCIDSVSFLAETLRRVLCDLTDDGAPPLERLPRLRALFAPHLRTLSNASRPLDDWILDNMLNPLDGQTFSIELAIATLGAEGCEFYASAPRFVAPEWRWYKALSSATRRSNDLAREAYLANVLTLLDCRYVREPHDAAFGRMLLERTGRIYDAALASRRGEAGARRIVVDELGALVEAVAVHAPETAASLDAYRRLIAGELPLEAAGSPEIAGFFGRGQQHVSFIRS